LIISFIIYVINKESNTNPSIAHKKRNHLRPVNFTRDQLEFLMNWLDDNINHPYPSKRHLACLVRQTGLQKKQVHLWCTNARRRHMCVKVINGERRLAKMEQPTQHRSRHPHYYLLFLPLLQVVILILKLLIIWDLDMRLWQYQANYSNMESDIWMASMNLH